MNAFTGTGSLVRLALRRDRIMLPVWMAVFVLSAVSSAAATVGLYPSPTTQLQAAAAINDTPSLVALYGKVYDPASIGSLGLVKLGGFGSALVGVLAMVLLIRHTRGEEESGRLELLGGTVVGRYAPLTAALITVVGANVVLGLLTAVGLRSANLPLDGAVAFGLAWAGAGIVFTAVAAVAAQVTRTARAATGLTAAVIGAAYLLRAVGDSSASAATRWLVWLSPVGWAQQVRAFAGDRWWVLWVMLAAALAVIGAAYALVARRDFGAGLLPDRPGPAVGAPRLTSALALAWRLQRGTLLAWVLAYLVLGAVLGSIAGNLGPFLSSPQAQDMIVALGGQQGLTDAFLATEFGFVGVFTAAYGVQAALRLPHEETALHAESLLATPVGRLRWAAGHTVIAVGGGTVLLAVAGLSAGLTRAGQAHDPAQIARLTGAALAQAPAVWVLVGLVVLLFGLVPRWAVGGWALLVAFLLIGELGPLFRLDHRIMEVSPFAHVPKLPGGPVDAAALGGLTAVAVLLCAAGFTAFRRRDVG